MHNLCWTYVGLISGETNYVPAYTWCRWINVWRRDESLEPWFRGYCRQARIEIIIFWDWYMPTAMTFWRKDSNFERVLFFMQLSSCIKKFPAKFGCLLHCMRKINLCCFAFHEKLFLHHRAVSHNILQVLPVLQSVALINLVFSQEITSSLLTHSSHYLNWQQWQRYEAKAWQRNCTPWFQLLLYSQPSYRKSLISLLQFASLAQIDSDAFI